MLETRLPAAFVLAVAGAVQADEIVIDGEFDDWTAIPTAIDDPVDSESTEVDFGEIKISHDDERVHLLVDFGREVTVQRLDGRVLFILDADGNEGTGQTVHGLDGVDLVVELSPRDPRQPTRPGMGLGIRALGEAPIDPSTRAVSPYEAGIMMGPTCANRQVEFRLVRGSMVPPAPSLLGGDEFSIKLVALDGRDRVADETEIVRYHLDGAGTRAPGQTSDPLARADGTDVRVMTWNAERGSIFDRAAPYMRTISAVAPDVILFQELTERNSAEQLQSLLNQTVPAGENQRWNVVFGAGGGNLRCAVAARAPIAPVDALTVVPVPDREDRSIRVVGAAVEVGGRPILFVSCHLKCCGSLGSREDVIRRTEVLEIRKAIRRALNRHDYAAVVVGGDMNLVGSCEILGALAEGIDLDGSALDDVPAYQIDGRSNVTWTDSGQPFVPGRLDYLLCSDSSAEIAGAFVFEADDLSTRWLGEHGLRGDDSKCSDHLPVVADLRFHDD